MNLQRTVSCVWNALSRRDERDSRAERATQDARTWLQQRQHEAQRRLEERRRV